MYDDSNFPQMEMASGVGFPNAQVSADAVFRLRVLRETVKTRGLAEIANERGRQLKANRAIGKIPIGHTDTHRAL